MKKTSTIMIAFCILLLLIPSMVFLIKGSADNDENVPSTSNMISDISKVDIIDYKTKDIMTMDIKDYLIYSTLSQISPYYNIEAIKAQVILSHTYILNRKINESLSKTKELCGAIISTDEDKYASIFTTEQGKEYYGDKFNTYLERVTKAVEEVQDLVITYKKEPIVVAFYPVSFGFSESSSDIWGKVLPYLSMVKNENDKDSSIYKNEKTFSFDEFSKIMKEQLGLSINFDENIISITKKTKNNTPLRITISGVEVSATDFYKALDLPSQHFEVKQNEETITFKTLGVGHLVGMSQYGAHKLGESGKSFREILKFYFNGTELYKSVTEKTA